MFPKLLRPDLKQEKSPIFEAVSSSDGLWPQIRHVRHFQPEMKQ